MVGWRFSFFLNMKVVLVVFSNMGITIFQSCRNLSQIYIPERKFTFHVHVLMPFAYYNESVHVCICVYVHEPVRIYVHNSCIPDHVRTICIRMHTCIWS